MQKKYIIKSRTSIRIMLIRSYNIIENALSSFMTFFSPHPIGFKICKREILENLEIELPVHADK